MEEEIFYEEESLSNLRFDLRLKFLSTDDETFVNNTIKLLELDSQLSRKCHENIQKLIMKESLEWKYLIKRLIRDYSDEMLMKDWNTLGEDKHQYRGTLTGKKFGI